MLDHPIRIIPRLDIKGPNVVKGIHLEGLRVIGRPDEMARYYYQEGADELFFMDVVASLYERNSLTSIIKRTAEEIFIPLTVGGGLRSIADMSRVLHAGADKVCINTAAIKNPNFIREAAHSFGSSTIVVGIEAIKQENRKWLAYTDNGREFTGIDVVDWAKKVEELGAGEIVITSVDREGTGEGFDIELVSQLSSNVSIPIIAHGGAGKHEHVAMMIKESQADAVALASILHYEYVKHCDNGSASELEGNTEFLKMKKESKCFDIASVRELKTSLIQSDIKVRITN